VQGGTCLPPPHTTHLPKKKKSPPACSVPCAAGTLPVAHHPLPPGFPTTFSPPHHHHHYWPLLWLWRYAHAHHTPHAPHTPLPLVYPFTLARGPRLKHHAGTAQLRDRPPFPSTAWTDLPVARTVGCCTLAAHAATAVTPAPASTPQDPTPTPTSHLTGDPGYICKQ